MTTAHNDPSSVITGSSTHNERIERLWNDVRRSATEEFRCLFYQLEDEGLLNPLNETDLFCLHYVFLGRINQVIDEFTSSWNNHKLSTERNRSPNQLFITGMLSTSPVPAISHPPTSTVPTLPSQAVPTVSAHAQPLSHVPVPRSTFAPCTSLIQALSHVNTLETSHNYGKDIFLHVLSIVTSHLRSSSRCDCA